MKRMVEEAAEDEGERLTALATRVRAAGVLDRSEMMIRLFDFLLAQSLAGRSPKEVEVAQDVFRKDGSFDVGQDASVRVHIHRLRRKLSEIGFDDRGERLTIPRGEYRLAIERSETADAESMAPIAPPGLDPARSRRWRRWALPLMLLVTLAVGVVGGQGFDAWRDSRTPLAALGRTRFWRPLAASHLPSLVVVGDYYIFGDAPDNVQVTRLIRQFTINSRDDLDDLKMNNPSATDHYVDLDLFYLPTSAAYALRELLPVLNSLGGQVAAGYRPPVITMSQMTTDELKRFNVIYTGYFSSLGALRGPLFQASGFAIGSSYDELIDRASGRHFVSDWEADTQSRAPHRDYAYLASVPGPVGNRVFIVAGTRDPAAMQAAEIAADKTQLDLIASRTGNADAFEALYEVSTIGTMNVGSKLVLARAIKPNGMWQADGSPKTFPDELPNGSANQHYSEARSRH